MILSRDESLDDRSSYLISLPRDQTANLELNCSLKQPHLPWDEITPNISQPSPIEETTLWHNHTFDPLISSRDESTDDRFSPMISLPRDQITDLGLNHSSKQPYLPRDEITPDISQPSPIEEISLWGKHTSIVLNQTNSNSVQINFTKLSINNDINLIGLDPQSISKDLRQNNLTIITKKGTLPTHL